MIYMGITDTVAENVDAWKEGIIVVGGGREAVKKDDVGSVQLGHRPLLQGGNPCPYPF